MAEVLQTNRPGVALLSFQTLTRASAYKNAPKTHQTAYLKATTATNMEHPAQDQIERILDRVHSLDDLSADDIIELRHLSEQSIVIDKFKIFPAQYYDWLDRIGDNICGVESDAQHACVIYSRSQSIFNKPRCWERDRKNRITARLETVFRIRTFID